MTLREEAICSFLVDNRLLPSERLQRERCLVLLKGVLRTIVRFRRVVTFFSGVTTQNGVTIFISTNVPTVHLVVRVQFCLVQRVRRFRVIRVGAPRHFLVKCTKMGTMAIRVLYRVSSIPRQEAIVTTIRSNLRYFRLQ